MLLESLVVGTMVLSSAAAHLLNKRDNVKQADIAKEDRVMFYTANEAKEKVVEKYKEAKDKCKYKKDVSEENNNDKKDDATVETSSLEKENPSSSEDTISTEEVKPPKFTVVDDNDNETK